METRYYPPPPCIAEAMGDAGNPACHCPTPLAALFCLEGHMTECHAGMSCEDARCGHLLRSVPEEDDHA